MKASLIVSGLSSVQDNDRHVDIEDVDEHDFEPSKSLGFSRRVPSSLLDGPLGILGRLWRSSGDAHDPVRLTLSVNDIGTGSDSDHALARSDPGGEERLTHRPVDSILELVNSQASSPSPLRSTPADQSASFLREHGFGTWGMKGMAL